MIPVNLSIARKRAMKADDKTVKGIRAFERLQRGSLVPGWYIVHVVGDVYKTLCC